MRSSLRFTTQNRRTAADGVRERREQKFERLREQGGSGNRYAGNDDWHERTLRRLEERRQR